MGIGDHVVRDDLSANTMVGIKLKHENQPE